MTINCPNCNEQLADDAVFCDECGVRLDAVVTETPGDSVADVALNAQEHIPIDSILPDDNDKELGLHTSNNSHSIEVPEVPEVPEVQEAPEVPDTPATPASDCQNFIFRWNQTTSQFIGGIGSSLQFELSPKSKQAGAASDFKMFLKFPGDPDYTEQKLQYVTISRAVQVSVNYRPTDGLVGVNQATELYFSYKIDGQDHWFSKQLAIDIYPSNQNPDKVIENFNIRIDSIHQEGKAGDPNLSLFDNLKLENNVQLDELLNKLKDSAPLWSELELIKSHKPNIEVYSEDKTEVLQPTEPRLTSQSIAEQPPVAPQVLIQPENTEMSSGSSTSKMIGAVVIGILLIALVIYFNNNSEHGQAVTIKTNVIIKNSPQTSVRDTQVENLLNGKVNDLDDELKETENKLQEMVGEYKNLEDRSVRQARDAKREQQSAKLAQEELTRHLAKAKSELETRDSDNDGILDVIELKYGLNPKIGTDAMQDKDNDGFTNKTEILALYKGTVLRNSTDHLNPLSHPSLALRLEVLPPRKPDTAFLVKSIDYVPNSSGDSNVTIQYAAETGSNLKKLQVYDVFKVDEIQYTITDIRSTSELVFNKALWKNIKVTKTEVEIKSSTGTVLTLTEGHKTLRATDKTLTVKDSHTSKSYKLGLDDQIILGNINTGKETFKVSKINELSLILIDVKTDEPVTIRIPYKTRIKIINKMKKSRNK